MFAAYGQVLSTLDIPCAIPENNTWGLSDVKFTEDEFEDYVSRFCGLHLGLKDDDSKLIQEWVARTTGYHPGLVACFMDKIKADLLVKHKELTFQQIFWYLKSSGFNIAMGHDARVCAALHKLTSEEIALCDKLYLEGPTYISMGSQEGWRLIKTGLLSLERQKLTFASPYLCALYFQHKHRSPYPI